MAKKEKYTTYSVVMSVCSKDKPEYVRQGIESILLQTLPTDDFVIVKCGNIPKELNELLDQLCEKNMCINIVIHNPDRGLGAALNVGIRNCKNELIARMDPDDYSDKSRCKREVEQFNRDKDLSVVGTDMIKFRGNINNVVGRKNMPHTYEEIYKYGKRGNPYCHPTVMYRKSMVIKQGGYLEIKKSEDFEFFTRLTAKKVKGINIPEGLHYFRADEEQYKRRTSWEETKSIIQVEYRNFRKGYAGLGDLAVLTIKRMGAMVIPSKLGGFLAKHYTI